MVGVYTSAKAVTRREPSDGLFTKNNEFRYSTETLYLQDTRRRQAFPVRQSFPVVSQVYRVSAGIGSLCAEAVRQAPCSL